jgi:hypothetical protein
MITEGQFHRKPSWIQTLWTWVLMCILMIPLAWMFVIGLQRQEFVDQARLAKHFESVLYRGQLSTDVTPPAAPTGVRLSPADLAKPRTRVFQDASTPRRTK